MAYLSNHPAVVWIADFDGDFDAAFLVWADTIREFEKVYDEINEHYGSHFLEKYFSIATKIEYVQYKFLNSNQHSRSIIFGDCYGNYSLDALNKNILSALNQRGRVSLVELAAANHTSAKVIKDRITRLMKDNIILGFNVKINHHLLGYTHRKVLLKLNSTSKENIAFLSRYLRAQKNVIFIIKPIGDYDLEFEVMTSSNEEFHDLIKELRSRFSGLIRSHNVVIHHDEPKSGQMTHF